MKMLVVLLFILFPFLNLRAENIAVIIKGEDRKTESFEPLSSNDRIYAKSSKDLEDLYRKAGYEIVFIDAKAGDTAETFKKKVLALKNIDRLEMAVVGHGTLISNDQFSSIKKKNLTAKLPLSHFTDQEIDLLKIGNDAKGKSLPFAYVLQNDPWELSVENLIGMGDIHNVLTHLKLHNPQMKTTFITLNCFGGNIIRALNSIPDLQVFSSSPANNVSVTGYMSTSDSLSDRDYIRFIAQRLGSDISYLEAHQQAKFETLQMFVRFFDIGDSNLGSVERYLGIPLSSMESYVKDQCLGKPEAVDLPYCFEDSLANVLDKSAVRLFQTQITPALQKSLGTEEHYLNYLKAFAQCGRSDLKIPKHFFKKSINILNQYRGLSADKQNDLIVEEIKKLQGLRTLEELKKFDYDSDYLKIQKNYNSPQEQFDALQRKLVNNRLNEYPQEIVGKSDRNETLTLIKEQNYEECVKKDSCDLEVISDYLKIKWGPIAPFSPHFFRNPRVHALDLLEKNCPSNRRFSDMSFDPNKARDEQIRCVNKIGEKSPLDALAIYSILETVNNKKKIFCRAIEQKSSELVKLKSCIKNFDKIDDEAFWNKMMSLQLQQLQSL